MKLRGMSECDLGSLFGHRAGDLLDTVAYADDGGLAGRVEKTLAICGNDPGAFAADGDGKGFLKIAGKE